MALQKTLLILVFMICIVWTKAVLEKSVEGSVSLTTNIWTKSEYRPRIKATDDIYIDDVGKRGTNNFDESSISESEEHDKGRCQTKANNCASDATCISVRGSVQCLCSAGFTGDGTVCSDFDECASPGDNDCGINSTCNNTPGSFACTCKDGFFRNGTLCLDFDECASPGDNDCGTNAICNNTVGSFACVCNDGFIKNGTDCVAEPAQCPEGWVYAPIYQKCLIRPSSRLSWFGGQLDCQTRGGSLAQFNTLETLNEGKALVRLPGGSLAWIGVNQRTAGDCNSYSTLDGVSIPLSSPLWATGQPSDCSSGGAKCVLIRSSDGLFGDIFANLCVSGLDIFYICELPPM